MEYDLTRCNNLNFKLSDGTTGFIKVSPKNDLYLYSSQACRWNIINAMPTFELIAGLNTEEFTKAYIEKHSLEIIPRDPETYTDWKVGDRVMNKYAGGLYTIAAKLGDIVFLLSDNDAVVSICTAQLAKYYTLVLTDYEQELIHAEQEKKKECPFKEGDKVLVRDSDTSWKFDVFQNYEENACYSYECLSSEYEQCIPLNEHTWRLLGTTDEYKEEE